MGLALIGGGLWRPPRAGVSTAVGSFDAFIATVLREIWSACPYAICFGSGQRAAGWQSNGAVYRLDLLYALCLSAAAVDLVLTFYGVRLLPTRWFMSVATAFHYRPLMEFAADCTDRADQLGDGAKNHLYCAQLVCCGRSNLDIIALADP